MELMRHEDKRLITGTGKFTADWNRPDQLHAYVLRSDRAHAKLLAIDTTEALTANGVVSVLTASDITAAHFNTIPSGPDLKGVDDQAIIKSPLPILAIDRVRFVGQPVAMVIAESANLARDAAELIEVDYEDLPAVTSVDDALQSDTALHAAAPDNVSLHFESGDEKAVADAFASAAKTSQITIHSQRLAGAPMEPRALSAHYDAERDITTVCTPTQGMLGMRASLSAVTGVPQEQLDIVADDVGGSFGLRGGTLPEHAMLVLATRKLGRPVKWVSQRSELFIGEWHGRGLELKGSIALDADDRITAIRFEDTADLGAYNCYFGGFIGTNNLSVTMGGVYQVPALYMQSRLIYTNKVPVSAYRGAGRPDIAFAIERLIDHTAAEHGLDPVEFRRKNFVPKDAFPYTTANGSIYDCGDFESVMNRALKSADYAGFAARRKASTAAGKIRGIGFGCYVEKSGAGGAPRDDASCRFIDGRIHLFGVTGPSGQGHESTFARIISDGLGIPTDLISYRAGDSAQELIGNGTGGSRSLYGAGSAFKNLVQVVIDKATPHAAELLNVEPADVTFADGQFIGRNGAQGISLLHVAGKLKAVDGEHPLDSVAHTVTGANYPNGCHVAEIEIDPDTGVTELLAYTSVDDLGNVIHPELVRGQVHGGVVQGAGQAFCEQIVYDDSGQLLSGSFMDYAMPRAGTVHKMHNETYAVPTELNELGSKGVGESGCSGSLPAISNAMMDALRSVGVGSMDMPYTPDRLWKVLQQVKKSA
jgi:carbon-monoxide dehydrogenase large subunit